MLQVIVVKSFIWKAENGIVRPGIFDQFDDTEKNQQQIKKSA